MLDNAKWDATDHQGCYGQSTEKIGDVDILANRPEGTRRKSKSRDNLLGNHIHHENRPRKKYSASGEKFRAYCKTGIEYSNIRFHI